MRKMMWNRYTRVLKNRNKVILGNRYNGQWIKISNECYEILDLVISKKFTDDRVINSLEDEDDKKYFKKLLDILYDAELLVEEQHIGEALDIDIAITNRCNLNCKHCCVDANTVGSGEVMSTQEIKKNIKKVVASNPKSICLTGGEPLVRIDFEEILQYLREIFSGEIRLMTNGTLINEYFAKLISQNVDAVDISLDGIDEHTCSKIRGKGVFDKVVHAISLLQENGLKNISLSMVLTKDNYPLRKEFALLNEKLKTRAVVRAFSPIGRGKKNSMILNPGEHEKCIEHDREWNKVAEDYHICCCGALNKELYINAEGDIFPCGLLERNKYILGNIRYIDNFQEFVNKEKYRKTNGDNNWLSLQPENHEFCKECNVNLFCWNCLHYLDLLEGNETYFKMECSEIQQHLRKVIWEEE